MLAALRYRWVQALVLILLAALVTACSVMAPLYNRAVDQAMVAATLEKSTSSERGLRLSSGSSSQPVLSLSSTALDDLVPDTIREYFEPPIAGSSVTVRRMPLLGEPEGRLLYRAGMCDHVRFVSGRCPARARSDSTRRRIAGSRSPRTRAGTRRSAPGRDAASAGRAPP